MRYCNKIGIMHAYVDIYNLNMIREMAWICHYNSQGSSTIENSDPQITLKKQSKTPTLRMEPTIYKRNLELEQAK